MLSGLQNSHPDLKRLAQQEAPQESRTPANPPRRIPADPESFLRACGRRIPPPSDFRSDNRIRPGHRLRPRRCAAFHGVAPRWISSRAAWLRVRIPALPQPAPFGRAVSARDRFGGLAAATARRERPRDTLLVW